MATLHISGFVAYLLDLDSFVNPVAHAIGGRDQVGSGVPESGCQVV